MADGGAHLPPALLHELRGQQACLLSLSSSLLALALRRGVTLPPGASTPTPLPPRLQALLLLLEPEGAGDAGNGDGAATLAAAARTGARVPASLLLPRADGVPALADGAVLGASAEGVARARLLGDAGASESDAVGLSSSSPSASARWLHLRSPSTSSSVGAPSALVSEDGGPLVDSGSVIEHASVTGVSDGSSSSDASDHAQPTHTVCATAVMHADGTRASASASSSVRLLSAHGTPSSSAVSTFNVREVQHARVHATPPRGGVASSFTPQPPTSGTPQRVGGGGLATRAHATPVGGRRFSSTHAGSSSLTATSGFGASASSPAPADGSPGQGSSRVLTASRRASLESGLARADVAAAAGTTTHVASPPRGLLLVGTSAAQLQPHTPLGERRPLGAKRQMHTPTASAPAVPSAAGGARAPSARSTGAAGASPVPSGTRAHRTRATAAAAVGLSSTSRGIGSSRSPAPPVVPSRGALASVSSTELTAPAVPSFAAKPSVPTRVPATTSVGATSHAATTRAPSAGLSATARLAPSTTGAHGAPQAGAVHLAPSTPATRRLLAGTSPRTALAPTASSAARSVPGTSVPTASPHTARAGSRPLPSLPATSAQSRARTEAATAAMAPATDLASAVPPPTEAGVAEFRMLEPAAPGAGSMSAAAPPTRPAAPPHHPSASDNVQHVQLSSTVRLAMPAPAHVVPETALLVTGEAALPAPGAPAVVDAVHHAPARSASPPVPPRVGVVEVIKPSPSTPPSGVRLLPAGGGRVLAQGVPPPAVPAAAPSSVRSPPAQSLVARRIEELAAHSVSGGAGLHAVPPKFDTPQRRLLGGGGAPPLPSSTTTRRTPISPAAAIAAVPRRGSTASTGSSSSSNTGVGVSGSS